MKMGKKYNVYIASCASDGGIYHYEMDGGRLELKEKTDCDSPMYLAESDGRMYTILKEPFGDSEHSGLTYFDINDDGSLGGSHETLSTKGVVACHLAVDGKNVYCVNYVSGSVIKMPDKLVVHSGHGPHPVRQTSPHTHFTALSPDKKYIFVVDLGLDSIFVYDKDLNEVSRTCVSAGHGARHLAYSENGKYVFCANELAATVSVFAYDDGRLELLDTAESLPKDFCKKNLMAAIRVCGDYVYASNRGQDAIVCYKFENGRLTLKNTVSCGGNSPRDFNMVGEYILCTNENSDNVTVFKFDGDKIEKLPDELHMAHPLCVISSEK